MNDMSDRVKSELKLLPFMIGKALGGIVAVIGFTAAVVIVTRRTAPSFADILPSALSGCLGILVFVLSSTLLTRRLSENPSENATSDDGMRTSVLSWAILLLLAAVFLLCTYLIAR
jgi:zinc transporter ZupT